MCFPARIFSFVPFLILMLFITKISFGEGANLPPIITLPYPVISHQLTVLKTRNGTGTVIGNQNSVFGDNINCGDDCKATYPQGTKVILTAAPALNSYFSNWTGDCKGSGPSCTVTLNTAKTVTAVFKLYRLLTVKRTGTACECTPEKIANEFQVLEKALADACIELKESLPGLGNGWCGNVFGTGPTCDVVSDEFNEVWNTYEPKGLKCVKIVPLFYEGWLPCDLAAHVSRGVKVKKCDGTWTLVFSFDPWRRGNCDLYECKNAPDPTN